MATRSHAAIQLNTPHPCRLSVRTDIARAHFGMSLNDSLLRRAGSKPRSLARPSQSRIAMLSFGSPPLKEGSQAQIAAAFFSFVSYFDQTRQSRGKRLSFPTLAQRARQTVKTPAAGKRSPAQGRKGGAGRQSSQSISGRMEEYS
jgi:hypothetical protein